MTDYYHCTSKKSGLSIRKSGFRNSPTKDEISNYFQEFAEHFPEEEARAVLSLWSEKDDRAFIEASVKLWNSKFNHGTVLWVSEVPDVVYGESCFRFTLPKDAIMVRVSGENDYFLVWVPMKPIPSKYFTLLSADELESLRDESL